MLQYQHPGLYAALDPKTARAIERRLADPEDFAFLLPQMKFEKGRIWFPHGIGWIPVPNFDPTCVPVHDIHMLSWVKVPTGYTLEVRFKSGWKPGMPFPQEA
jgi:hypothetical protein